MTKKIIFRADGDSSTGLGHIYRLFSLVEIVKNTYEFIFVTRETSTQNIIPRQYPKETIPKEISIEIEPEWLSLRYPPEEYILIADGYQFKSLYQKQIKVNGYKLIYIDDLAKEHMFADVVINHSPYLKHTHYNKEAYTTLALGTKYALLRPQFLKAAKQKRLIETVDIAFVCFGGADPFNLTLKAVEALLQIPNFKKIHVVLGGAYMHEEVFSLEKKFSIKIKTYKNLSEGHLFETMQQCNFAIVPASTILYELCCVKMPILSGFYVDNQQLIYKGFLKNGAIYRGDNLKDYQTSDFFNKLELILKEQKYNDQIEVQKALFDEKIPERHLNFIRKLC